MIQDLTPVSPLSSKIYSGADTPPVAPGVLHADEEENRLDVKVKT